MGQDVQFSASPFQTSHEPVLLNSSLQEGRATDVREPLPIPSRPPRPAEQVKSFVDTLTGEDAKIEVVVGQGRMLTLKSDLAPAGKNPPLVAVGDPTVVNFELVGPRHIRLTGNRLGITDLSILTSDDESYTFLVHVIADLEFLQARLLENFPDATLKLGHLREHVVVEGQARDTRQVSQILATIQAYLNSIQTSRSTSGQSSAIPAPTQQPGASAPPAPEAGPAGMPPEGEDAARSEPQSQILPETGNRSISATAVTPEIINLIRVPGPQQILLKVQVAELNRTALRQLGVSFLLQDENRIVGQNVAGLIPGGGGGGGGGGGATGGTTAGTTGTGGAVAAGAASLLGFLNPLQGTGSTVFGVFDGGDASFFVNALRQNQVFKILAEPNLVAMHGQEANFLSGGEFPILVPQPGGAGGATVVTTQFRNFGVELTFVPYILDDRTIRLAVAPSVSSLDFATGVTISGTTVPGLATRRARTVVEIKEGQTLAISGILQITMDGTTARIPGLGDLPYIGQLFSDNSAQIVEKELVILVTPFLVESMRPDQVPPLPGDDVQEPTDHEFYLKGRIERRVCEPYRGVASWDDPLGVDHRRAVETQHVYGPYGYSW